MFINIEEKYIQLAKKYNLSSSELLIMSYLYGFIEKGNECFATNKKISDSTNCSIKTVTRSIDKLNKLNLINTSFKDGRRTVTWSKCLEVVDKMSIDGGQNVSHIYKSKNKYNIYNESCLKKKGFKNYTESDELTEKEKKRIESLKLKYIEI